MFLEVYNSQNTCINVETEFEYMLRLFDKELSIKNTERFSNFLDKLDKNLAKINYYSKFEQTLSSLEKENTCLINITHIFSNVDTSLCIKDIEFYNGPFKVQYLFVLKNLYEKQGRKSISLISDENAVLVYKKVDLFEILTPF